MKSFYNLIVVLVAPASHFLQFFLLFSQFCFRDNSWQEKVLQLGRVRPGYKGYGARTCPTLSRENQTDGSTEWEWQDTECQWSSYCQWCRLETDLERKNSWLFPFSLYRPKLWRCRSRLRLLAGARGRSCLTRPSARVVPPGPAQPREEESK